MIAFILTSFFTLALIGVPVGIVIALTTLFGFYYTDDVVVNPLRMENGAVKAPHSPGLGVTIDENQTARYSIAF